MKNLSVQLYTVRNQLQDEGQIQATLEAIKAIGYTSVQLYGTMELLEKCAKYSEAAGLRVMGILADLNFCEENREKLLALCRRYSMEDLGISAKFAEFAEPEAYIARVNALAAKVKAAGFSFSYHNHAAEFITLSCGKTAMACFLEGFDRENVTFMPDTYWLQEGGYDVRHFLEQVWQRVSILHLKDMRHTADGHTFAEIGSGSLWFEGILRSAGECGVKHFVVEQDICDGDPLDSLRKSHQYLQSI